MSSNKNMVHEAREGLNRFKMEAANEVGVNLKQGYNGDLTSKQAGSIGGQMVKKMIQQYENCLLYTSPVFLGQIAVLQQVRHHQHGCQRGFQLAG